MVKLGIYNYILYFNNKNIKIATAFEIIATIKLTEIK